MKVFSREARSKLQQADPYNLGRFRLLLVEDSGFILGLLYSCLRQMGVGEVVRATSLETAKDRISSYNGVNSVGPIDIVLLDWLMPEGNGSELLSWMRHHKRDSIRFLPVIICSAFTDAELVHQSRDLGANEVMVKPVSAEKIAERILRIIDQPRPYLNSPGYVGPDRRRRTRKPLGPERRIHQPEMVMERDDDGR